MTTCMKASTTQSGKLISSPPPSKQGSKRATSAVDTGSKAKKKKAEVAESSEEEQEETKSHKNARKKSYEAKNVTVASVPPVSVHPPVSACQHHLEAHTEHAAAVVEDMNSDSSSSDDDTQLACAHSHVLSDDSSVVSTKSGTLLATVPPGDSTPIDQRLESHGSSLTNEDMAKVNTTFTISTGHAHGNVFNHVDVDDFIESDVIPTKGEVHLYTSHGDPQQTDPSKVKPAMFVKHEMSSLTLGPVLNKLGSRFSPIKKSNSHIFTWEEDMWNIKGRFEDAIQDDDDAPWVKENN
ncbi:hypothetical protein H0H87_009304, partial [Tephrocybe sp. NHM501043]